MTKLISLLVLMSYGSTIAHAADLRLLDDRHALGRGQAEYYNTNNDHRLENKVNFVSGVQTPGIYHFPDNINLLEAISLAGGAEKDADLSNVYVKRYTKDGFVTFKYDLSDMVAKKEVPFPSLNDRDTVLLETSHSTQNTMLVLTVITTVLAIGVSSLILIQNSKK